MNLIERIRYSGINRSAFRVLSFNSFICGIMAGHCIKDQHPDAAMIITTVPALVVLGWCIWALVIVCTCRQVKQMPQESYSAIDVINTLLFAYWIAASFISGLYGSWLLPALAIVWIASMIIGLFPSLVKKAPTGQPEKQK